MIQTVDFRVPGVFFLPVQPEPRLPLPRLDVAAFVGFAERGPLHLPVPVEDFAGYRALFGGDLPLARETGGRIINANLPRAVHSFFANGGRRCYVVRIAGRHAEAARFRLPSMVALGGATGARLAAVSASSPGAWGSRLRLATRQSVVPLPPTVFGWTLSPEGHPVLQAYPAALRLAGLSSVQSGDLLRLALADGSRWLAVVEVERTSPAPSTLAAPLSVHLRHIYRLHEKLATSPPEVVQRLERLTVDGSAPLASVGGLIQEQGRIALTLDRADLPHLGAGDIVRVHLANTPISDLGYLTRVEEIHAASEPFSASPSEEHFVALFGEFLQLTQEALPLDPTSATLIPLPLQSIELLRLDLLLRLQDERLAPLVDMAFCAPHPRFWGDSVLLGSSRLAGQQPNQSQPSVVNGSTTRKQANPNADASAWFRHVTDDPYDIIPLPGEQRLRQEPSSRSFSPSRALAALLAPAGSTLGMTVTAAQTANGYPESAEESSLVYLPIGLREIVEEGDPAQFRPPEAGRSGGDDLDHFDAARFYDPYLAPAGAGSSVGIGESPRTLLNSAFDLHYLQGRRLRGLHSLLFLDEVALIGVPDAVHHPWQHEAALPEAEPPRPAQPDPPPACPPQADFADCNRAPTIHSIEPYYGNLTTRTGVTVRGEGFTSEAETHLFFGLRRAENLQVQSSSELTALAPPGTRIGPVDVSVANPHGSALLASGFIYTGASATQRLPVVLPPALTDLVQNEPFLTVHQALIMACAARSDVMAVLCLPGDYDRARCEEWQQALRQRLGLPGLGEDFAYDEPTEIVDLSFAAVYHPWLLGADPRSDNKVRPVPPDGAICGLIAAREHRRHVWVAPANVPLNEVLGLQLDFSDDDWAELFARRFNLIRPEAGDFRPMSAHTLSGERSLMQISVRRLLILLRKAAVQLGMDFVFESNHEVFREGIRVVLEELLRFLYERGAFAGRTPDESFRVTTDASVNTPQSVEQGRFIAIIQVAPSQPMEFITVQLTRRGEGELLATEG